MAVVLLGATTRPAQATFSFNICNVFPWLPQCHQECVYDCDEPSPDPEPEATPEAVPLTQGAEGCSQDCSPEYHAPVCNGVLPDKPAWVHVDRVSPTEIKLEWAGNNTDYFVLSYGYVSKGDLPYGVPKINSDLKNEDGNYELNISQLAANQSINVHLDAWRGNCSIGSQTIDP